MQVHRGLDQLPLFRKAVLTIGSFDGVHHGHRAIISRLIQKAHEVSGESIILTFDPHPRQVVFPNDDSLKLLNTIDEKITLLEATGLDHLVIVPFTVEFSQMNPYAYVDDILIDKLNVKHLIIGYDHRFGLNREGNIDLLNTYTNKNLLSVEEIKEQDVDDLRVSSTTIRNHLLDGNVEKANKLLGSPYQLTGSVTKGSQIGGSLGYPTANCNIKESTKLIPASGTYAAMATCNNKSYNGMLYIGKSPTLQQRDKDIIEMNLFGKVSESLYGKHISISLLKRYRGDQKFENKAELIYNIGQDKVEIEHYFKARSQKTKVLTAILNYNGQHHLQTYLSSHKTSESSQVVVIDNASTDDSVSFLKSNYPEVEIINLKTNLGYAGGYNRGINHLGSKYIALVNSDVRVTKNWLDRIIQLMDKDDSIAAVQPKIRSINHPTQFEYAGAAGGMMDSMGYPLCRGRILDTVEEDKGQYDQQKEIFWASGAAMVIRTDLFKKAGGFDDDFFAHMEEIDLCWRLKKAGYKIFFEPASIVYHLGGGTLAYDHPRKIYLNLRNNYWMLIKNKSIRTLIFTLPLRFALDMAYACLFLLKGKVKHFVFAIKGIFTGLFKDQSSKRRTTNYFIKRYGSRSVNKIGMTNIILPITYYLLGKKKYSDYP